MVEEAEMMNEVNNVERVNGVKEIKLLGMVEKVRVNGKEDLNSDLALSDIEFRKKGNLVKLDEIPVKSAPEAAVVSPAIEVKPETKAEGTEKNNVLKDRDLEAKRNLNADLERAAVERLSEMERMAEKERQDKIRRREELDRMTRLKRILALVRAPELNSVAKANLVADLQQVTRKEMLVSEVVKETNPVLKFEKTKEVKERSEFKPEQEQLTEQEQETVQEVGQLVKKKIIKSEGIAKLERMSKSDRIAEIDRLANLELEAEAKRKAKVERIAELERLAEIERVAKMKRLTDVDLKAEMEEAEKVRLAEKNRQEKVRRREELERVARLQRVLAMILASESDQAVEAHAVNLERVKEMKLRDELKLLEELGIIPKNDMTKTESRKVNLLEEENIGATVATDTDLKPKEEVKPVSELRKKDVISIKGAMKMTTLNQLPEIKQRLTDVDADTPASVSNLTEIGSDKDMVAEAEREAKTMEDKAKANRETKRKQKEELERVKNSKHAIAMVRNTEAEQVAEMKRAAELKRREETKILEELGIVSKVMQSGTKLEDAKQVVVQLEEDVNSFKELNTTKATQDMKLVVKKENVGYAEQLIEVQNERKGEITLDAAKEKNIKRAAEMERNAKAEREARKNKKEDLIRVANLQRVVAMVHNEEFDYGPKIEKNNFERIVEKKRREDIKVLEELGLIPKEGQVHQSVENIDFTEIKDAKDTNFGDDFKKASEIGAIQSEHSVKEERVIDNERIKENEGTVKQNVERRLTELRVAQMKRVAELGREMKTGAIDKQHIELKNFTETEPKNTEIGQTVIENKPLAKAALPDVKQEVQDESKINGVEESKPSDFVVPEVKRDGVESVVEIGREVDVKPEFRRLPEIKREIGFETIELKRLIYMKRVVGIEQVRRRDCEWDGQMMYAGKA